MKKIRMGVIGLGGISNVHIGGTLKSPDAELVAVCDIDPDTLKVKGDLYGIPENMRFTNYHDLIACPEVDAISNCTPNNVHKEIAIAVLKSGKPLASEKPMTLNGAEAEEMYRVAQETGTKHMICFSYRFKAAARYARHLIQSGELGTIRHVYGQYLQANAIDASRPRVWRFNKAITGTGALGDLGSHAMDLVRFMTGAEYEDVVAHFGTFVKERQRIEDFKVCYNEKGMRSFEKIAETPTMEEIDVDDFSHMMANMTNGSSVTFEITRDAFGRGNYQRFEIYGSKGALVYDLDCEATGEDRLQACIGSFNGQTHQFNYVPIPDQFKTDQMQSFFDIINGKGDGMPATAADGYINMLTMDACEESAAEKKWVKIPTSI
ncbi:MAG: Gfo/Idh/MocA family oxidoreductase [Eubacteriales bacterium]|nr:Gfo/Idh/MocA family oxidoreductase [Eubacteriales bacterium]